MKILFEKFIKENPNCSKFQDNNDAEEIFNIISQERNILKMIELSDFEKPALSACVNEIESYFDGLLIKTIDLNDDFTRTAIGRMVKTVLNSYEYEVGIQKDLPKSCNAKYFKSASCYTKSKDAKNIRMIVEDDILEVKVGSKIFSNFHLVKTIKFYDDDTYKTTKVKIDDEIYIYNTSYEYRSQGNIHLIFFSEDGFYFSLSFDGHKGDMIVNRNPIIKFLINALNIKQSNSDILLYDVGNIEILSYLKDYAEINKK